MCTYKNNFLLENHLGGLKDAKTILVSYSIFVTVILGIILLSSFSFVLFSPGYCVSQGEGEPV